MQRMNFWKVHWKNARNVQIYKAYLYSDILVDFTNFNRINHKWYILKNEEENKTHKRDYRYIYIQYLIRHLHVDKKIKLTNKKNVLAQNVSNRSGLPGKPVTV